MAKKLAAILLCVVLIFVGVLALGHLTRPLGDDVAIANVENFHKLPENSIDVIVYGSSHAWRNVNVDEMYDKYGIGAYNYAANWQHLDTTWLFVHDSLATQTPKVALIEGMHINSNEFDTDMDGEIYYTTPIPESKYKRAYLKMCFENHIERYISYYFPLVAYHENKNALTAVSFGRTSNSIDFMDTMGHAILRPCRDPRRHGLPQDDREPGRRDERQARHQHAASRHRLHLDPKDRAACARQPLLVLPGLRDRNSRDGHV